MRAFLAFEVANDVTEKLLVAQEELKRTGGDIGPVGRDNLHFTVKFFGDIPDSAVGEIDLRIKRLKLHPLELAVRSVGAFPNPTSPRVVWVGVAPEDEAKVRDLSMEIISAVDGIGKPEDHEFHPHITLARVKSPRNADALSSFILRNGAREFGRTRIESLKLKSSVLTPKGAIYTDVREYKLS